jgi:hypothetical protein
MKNAPRWYHLRCGCPWSHHQRAQLSAKSWIKSKNTTSYSAKPKNDWSPPLSSSTETSPGSAHTRRSAWCLEQLRPPKTLPSSKTGLVHSIETRLPEVFLFGVESLGRCLAVYISGKWQKLETRELWGGKRCRFSLSLSILKENNNQLSPKSFVLDYVTPHSCSNRMATLSTEAVVPAWLTLFAPTRGSLCELTTLLRCFSHSHGSRHWLFCDSLLY